MPFEAGKEKGASAMKNNLQSLRQALSKHANDLNREASHRSPPTEIQTALGKLTTRRHQIQKHALLLFPLTSFPRLRGREAAATNRFSAEPRLPAQALLLQRAETDTAPRGRSEPRGSCTHAVRFAFRPGKRGCEGGPGQRPPPQPRRRRRRREAVR